MKTNLYLPNGKQKRPGKRTSSGKSVSKSKRKVSGKSSSDGKPGVDASGSGSMPKLGLGGLLKKAGNFALDGGKMLVDNTGNLVGYDAFKADDYHNDFMGDVSDVTNQVYKAGGIAAAGILGGPMGASAMGSVQQGVSGAQQNGEQEQAQQEALEQQQLNTLVQKKNKQLGTQTQSNVSKQPLFENGGSLPTLNNYMGQTHEGPQNGIPVDAQGNPSAMTGNKPVALTEKGEVNFEGYVFSDELEFED